METENKTNSPQQTSTKQDIDFDTLKKQLTSGFIYRCSSFNCKFKFPSLDERALHESAHTADNNDKAFRCFKCNPEVRFRKWVECCMHFWKTHTVSVGILECPIEQCNFRSQTTTKIYRHFQTHNKNYKCEYCDKRFAKPNLLKQHIENHELEEFNQKPRWYNQKTCDICSHTFANTKTLSKHIKQVHNKIKPFICKVCGYSAARKSILIIHERQHTGEKPLACRFVDCDFRAADPAVLVKHVRKHNENQSESRSYKCLIETCFYSSVQASALKAHIRVKHAEVFLQKIKCNLCNFTSVNEKILARHKLDHISGLIRVTEDSNEAPSQAATHRPCRTASPSSSDSFLPLESVDSIHDPTALSGGVTFTHFENTESLMVKPSLCSFTALPEDAQFPN